MDEWNMTASDRLSVIHGSIETPSRVAIAATTHIVANEETNVSLQTESEAIIVEFTGVTGVGKTKLVAAVKDVLSDQGFLARDAYDVILAVYGLNLARHPQLRSVLIDLRAFLPFLRYTSTREGLKLLHLATRAIRRDAGTLPIAANLLRNLIKRIGVHILLTNLQHRLRQCDFII